MAKIKFSNGQTVNFDGNPTEADIEEVAKSLGIQATPAPVTPSVPTPDQVSAQQYSASFPANTQTDTPLTAGLKTAGNLPSSALNLGKNVVQAVAHPIDTLSGMGNALLGGIRKGVQSATGLDINPSAQGQQATETYNQLSEALKQRYGSLENLQRTATNDPVGFATDILSLGRGGATLIGKGAEATKLASTIAKPVISTTEGVASFTKNLGTGITKQTVKQMTGLDVPTIQKVINNPEQFTPQAMQSTTRASVGSEVKMALDKRIESLGATGEVYNPLRQAKTPVKIDNNIYRNALAKQGIQVDETGHVVRTPDNIPLTTGDVKAIEDFLKVHEPKMLAKQEPLRVPAVEKQTTTKVVPTPAPEKLLPVTAPTKITKVPIGGGKPVTIGTNPGEKQFVGATDLRKGVAQTVDETKLVQKNIGATDLRYSQKPEYTQLNSNSFFNSRHALDELANWEGKGDRTSSLEIVAKDMRSALDETGKAQIKGLPELDAKYSAEITDLKQVRKDYLNSDGTLKDGALNKIANATGKGKDQLLARLEQLSPGISEKIANLKAVEDIQNVIEHHKVGSYAKGAGLGYLASAGNPLGVIVGIILSDPSNAVTMLRQFGMAKEKIAPFINFIQTQAGKANNPNVPPITKAVGVAGSIPQEATTTPAVDISNLSPEVQRILKMRQ